MAEVLEAVPLILTKTTGLRYRCCKLGYTDPFAPETHVRKFVMLDTYHCIPPCTIGLKRALVR